MVTLVEGQVYLHQKLIKNGNSFYLCIDKDMQEYLDIEKDKEGEFSILIKADKGKWGRFVGIGKDREEKR